MSNSKKKWFVIVLLGFIGQLAWMLENMYLNVYLYNELGGTPGDIAAMVALSAITATVTTLVMGSLSDRIGNRKSFIVFGYLTWGLSVLGFSLVTMDNVRSWFPMLNTVSTAVFIMILWDCVMTFLGSTANDAAFNSWITDNTVASDRGRVEAVLAVLPLMAMLLIFGLLDPLTKNGKWGLFYTLIGFIVFAGGLVALLLLKDTEIKQSGISLKDTMAYGFKGSTIKYNKKLYITMLILLIVSGSTQIWMPFLIIYIQKGLGIENYAPILGIVLLSASVISVLAGRLIDKLGKIKWIPIGLVIQIIGLLAMFVTKTTIPLIFAGIVLIAGNMILIAVSNGLIRDYTPDSMAGRFQGVRMIFGVMLPMIIGPFIGSLVIARVNETYTELGVVKQVPDSMIFLVSAILILLVLIPYNLLKKEDKR